MSRSPFTVADYGEAAVMVGSTDPDPAARQAQMRDFRERILQNPPPGFDDVVSGLESLLVEFDPLRTTPEQVAYALELLGSATAGQPDASRTRRSFVVPIVIDEETAPDIRGVADEIGMSVDETIGMIEGSEFTVALLAAAMAPMMTGLASPVAVKRRDTPRADVAAGSLMLAGRNAIIQPFPGPTGWRVVGRTPRRIVDIRREEPVSFSPGDVFRFRRCDAAEASALEGTHLEAAA